MNNLQTISTQTLTTDKLFFGSQERTTYLWKNLITEKRSSLNWMNKFYKNSMFQAFWTMFSAPVN